MLFSCVIFTDPVDTILYRSEYEKAGDQVGSVGSFGNNCSIVGGNQNGYYRVDYSGMIYIVSPIPDTFNVIKDDTLQIECSGQVKRVRIVDGYDYFIAQNPTYTVLSQHNQNDTTNSVSWSAYNNLWGRGTAIPDVDFRIALLIRPILPDSSIFLWDVPSQARDFGGASVWSYSNLLWGVRKGLRTGVPDFPVQVASLSKLILEFEFQRLFGDQNDKIALNSFLTDESEISPFNANDGDFFMVFDQIGTWLPPYLDTLPDTTLLGKTFAFRYKKDNSTGYEWRRVIIRNGNTLMSGSIDLKRIFNRFIAAGHINSSQYFPNIQIGVEVTRGFGAIRVNHLNLSPERFNAKIQYKKVQSIGSQTRDGSAPENECAVFTALGKRVKFSGDLHSSLKKLESGLYIVKKGGKIIRITRF